MAALEIHRAEEALPLNGRSGAEHAADEDLQPTYVWDLVVRVTHWTVVFSMIGLAATGIYIGRPFITAPGPANAHFVMGWAKVLHFYFAIAFSLAIVARIVWMFAGPRQSSWRQFIPTSRRRLRGLRDSFLFYIFVKPRPPRARGHNPLAGTMYVGVFGLYLVMILTGFAMYSVGAHSYMKMWQFLIPLFHGLQWARWIHHVVMWLLFAFVINHVYSAFLTSRVEKNGAIDSIISGYKFLPRNIPENDDDDDDDE